MTSELPKEGVSGKQGWTQTETDLWFLEQIVATMRVVRDKHRSGAKKTQHGESSDVYLNAYVVVPKETVAKWKSVIDQIAVQSLMVCRPETRYHDVSTNVVLRFNRLD